MGVVSFWKFTKLYIYITNIINKRNMYILIFLIILCLCNKYNWPGTPSLYMYISRLLFIPSEKCPLSSPPWSCPSCLLQEHCSPGCLLHPCSLPRLILRLLSSLALPWGPHKCMGPLPPFKPQSTWSFWNCLILFCFCFVLTNKNCAYLRCITWYFFFF